MNVYQFVTPNDAYSYQIKFTNYANMFGFPSGKTRVYTYGNIYLSDVPVQMSQENSLHIHCNLPRLRMGAIDNLSSNVLIESDIIAKIGMSGCAPYDTLTYSEPSDSHFTFYLSVKELQSTRIYVTNQNNNKIPLNLDWTMSIC